MNKSDIDACFMPSLYTIALRKKATRITETPRFDYFYIRNGGLSNFQHH